MRVFTGYVLAIVILLSGCAGGLVPDLARNVVVAPDGRSIVQTDESWQIKSMVYQESIVSTGSDALISFLVTAKNRTPAPGVISSDGFYLVLNGEVQKRPVSPQTVREVTLSAHNYLLPYPFVGYYYNRDETYPSILNVSPDAVVESAQEILLTAFPSGEVLPGKSVEGILYFSSPGVTIKSAELLFLPDGTTSETTPFRFPFIVAK